MTYQPRADMRSRLDVFKMRWFWEHGHDEYTLLDALLNVLRDELSAALPSTYENEEGKRSFFSWEERFLFRDVARTGFVSWKPTRPFLDGSIIGVRSRIRHKGPPFASLDLYVDADALLDGDFERSLFAAVGHVGRALGAFYAVALFAQNLVLVDGKVSGTLGSVIPRPRVMDNKCLLGLPWDGVVFEWFGPAYVPLLGEKASNAGWQIGGGILVKYANKQERFALLPIDLLESPPEGGPASLAPPGLYSAE